jgi:predicted aspartyl protease
VTDHERVGLTHIDGTVTGPLGQRTVRFLIDTGAQYSLLPHEVWRGLGLTRVRSLTFNLADGTRIDRAVSECLMELPEIGGETPRGHTPVILGEPGDVALLGVVTLENLGLVFNPFDRSLRPMLEAPLMRIPA